MKHKELIPFLFGALVAYDLHAQMDQFKSRSDFSNVFKNRIQNPAEAASESVQAADDTPSPFAQADGGADDFPADDPSFPGDNSEPTNAGAEINPDADIKAAEEATFGNRQQFSGNKTPKEKSKYVHLNPETGYGPEIISSFDFPNAEVMDVTKHIQKLTGINLILDKDVRGKVSIIAPSPITVGDAWKAYLTALNMSGYSIVKSGAFYKIINSRDIRYASAKIYSGSYAPNTESYIMRVFPLKNIGGEDLAREIRPFLSRYGRAINIKQSNTLLLYDTGDILESISKLIKFVDVPGHEETLHIIKVQHSSAQEIAKLIDEILKSKGQNAGFGRGGGAPSPVMGNESIGTTTISKLIAEPRTNSIIALANDEGAKKLRELIGKLDVKIVAGGSDRIHVYYLNFGNAEELAKTLTNIVSSAGTANSANASAPGRFTIGNIADQAVFTNEIKVTGDKANNALVVTASPTDWLTLKDVISRLDVPRDQVYVEGMILETSIEKNTGYGIEWAGAYGPGGAQKMTSIGDKANTSLVNLITTNITNLSGMFSAGFGLGGTRNLTIGGQSVTVNSVNGVIKAIASDANSNVLATPQILAMDNTEASFEMGETVPVQNTVNGVGGVTTTNVTQQKIAMVVKITPQINKITRFIKLKIDQKMEDINDARQSTASGGGVATITRATVTEVMVKDQDTIAMGGLMRDKESVAQNKIPILGDIPVLGWLFKSKYKKVSKTSLLFFLTPKILSPYDKTAAKISSDVMDAHRSRVHELLGDEKETNIRQLQNLSERLEQQKIRSAENLTSNAVYRPLTQEAQAPAPAVVEQPQVVPNPLAPTPVIPVTPAKGDAAESMAKLAPTTEAPATDDPNKVDYQDILKEVNEIKK